MRTVKFCGYSLPLLIPTFILTLAFLAVGCSKKEKEELMNPLAEGKWTIVNTTISAETGKEDEAKKVKDALPTSFELREDGSCSLNEIALPGQTWGFTGSILSIYSLMGNERMTIHEWNATIFVDKMTITYRASDKLTLVQREIAKAQELMDSNEITSTDKIPIVPHVSRLSK